MLTGSLIPTCGTARFGGVDLMEVNKKKPSLGLCPQFGKIKHIYKKIIYIFREYSENI